MDKKQSIEQKILGGILVSPTGFHSIHSVLRAEMFQSELHQKIFKAMAELYASNRPVRREMLGLYLPEELGGISTDATMSAMQHSALKDEDLPLVDFAEGFREDWTKKEGGRLLSDLGQKLATTGESSEVHLRKAKARIELLLGLSEQAKIVSFEEALASSLAQVSARYAGGDVIGCDLGRDFLNRLTGPWCPGQHIIIGAATKTGKSALAIDAAMAIARYGPVLYFSFEMTSGALAARELASITGISTRQQRSGAIKESEYERLDKAAREVDSAHNLKIISRKMDIEEIFNFVRRFKAETGSLAAVFVDHLGLLRPLKGSGRQDWEVAAQAAPIMKEIAEELNCISVSLSQLNKDTPYGRNFDDLMKACRRMPTDRDLKGAIANDADFVIMPFREAAALSRIEPAKDTEDYFKWKERLDLVRQQATIRLALAREGEWPQSVQVIWEGAKTRFLDPEIQTNNQLFEQESPF